jgi:hypothetical protein
MKKTLLFFFFSLLFLLFLVAGSGKVYAQQQRIIVVEKILEDEIIVKEISPQKFEIIHKLRNVQPKTIERLVIKDYLPLEVEILEESMREGTYKEKKWKVVTFSIPTLEPNQNKRVSYVITLSDGGNFSLYLGHKVFSFSGYEQEIIPSIKKIEVVNPKQTKRKGEEGEIDSGRSSSTLPSLWDEYYHSTLLLVLFISFSFLVIIILFTLLFQKRRKMKRGGKEKGGVEPKKKR